MRVTLRQLTHFVAAAHTGQVSRAATRCFVSQPTLTTSLKNLEDFLQIRLFTRHAEGLRLTVQGETFLRHAEHVLETLDTAVQESRAATSAVTGKIQIPLTDTISQYLLPRILLPIQRQLPGIELEFIEEPREQIESKLHEGRYEFALLLVSNLAAAPGIRVETLHRSPRRLWTAMGHPLSTRESVTLTEIEPLPFILLDMDDHVRTVERYWGAQGLKPNVVFKSKSIEAVRSLVAQNVGVTILSDLVYRSWSHDGGRIYRTRISSAAPSMDLGLAIREDANLSEATQAVVTALRSLSERFNRNVDDMARIDSAPPP